MYGSAPPLISGITVSLTLVMRSNTDVSSISSVTHFSWSAYTRKSIELCIIANQFSNTSKICWYNGQWLAETDLLDTSLSCGEGVSVFIYGSHLYIAICFLITLLNLILSEKVTAQLDHQSSSMVKCFTKKSMLHQYILRQVHFILQFCDACLADNDETGWPAW